MTEEEFQAWKHSPATRPFLKYLHDVREAMKERWATGDEVTDRDQALVVAYGDIINLEWSDVAEFYGQEEEAKHEE